jgi:PAS domain-containing protein
MDARTTLEPAADLGELNQLRARLAEAEAALRIMRQREGLAGQPPHGNADAGNRSMIDHLPQAGALLSLDGRIVYANRALAAMLGLPVGVMAVNPLRDYLPTSDRPVFDRLLDQGHGRGRFCFTRAGADPLPILVSLAPAASSPAAPGQTELLVMVVIDLTERYHDEIPYVGGRLARSILENTTEIIIVCDRKKRIILASRTARFLCGSDPAGCDFSRAFPLKLNPVRAGTIAIDQFKSSGRNRQKPIDRILQAALDGQILQGIDTTLPSQDGDDHEFILSVGPFFGDHPKVEG